MSNFGAPDPEDLARARLVKTVTPPVSFDKLVENAKQARAKGPVYDSTWIVLECLITEIASLKEKVASLEQTK